MNMRMFRLAIFRVVHSAVEDNSFVLQLLEARHLEGILTEQVSFCVCRAPLSKIALQFRLTPTSNPMQAFISAKQLEPRKSDR